MNSRTSEKSSLRSVSGFTLIELLIAITILSLIVALLYQAFATTSRVWSRQELLDENKARQIAAHRLLKSDLEQLVSYRYRHDGIEQNFFGGSGAMIFYATRNGFVARNRNQQGVFFACCYLRQDADGSRSLWIYKSAFPEKDLLQAFEDFIQAESQGFAFGNIPAELDKRSTRILTGLDLAGFYFQQKGDEQLQDGGFVEVDPTLSIQRKIPETFRFSYQLREQLHNLFIRPYADLDPVDPEKKGS